MTSDLDRMIQELPVEKMREVIRVLVTNINVASGTEHPWIPGGADWDKIREVLGPLYPTTRRGWHDH